MTIKLTNIFFIILIPLTFLFSASFALNPQTYLTAYNLASMDQDYKVPSPSLVEEFQALLDKIHNKHNCGIYWETGFFLYDGQKELVNKGTTMSILEFAKEIANLPQDDSKQAKLSEVVYEYVASN